MSSGANSLSMVRDVLFATMEQAEQNLEHFIAERDNSSLLQASVECLQQIQGTLRIVDLPGAALLAREMCQAATDIPEGAGSERDGQLSAISNALFVLRRYLENLETNRVELPELLIPVINELRQVCNEPLLDESYFFSVRLDHKRATQGVPEDNPVLQKRLRQMYQVGLLDLLRENKPYAGMKIMSRALHRLDGQLGAGPLTRLCWAAAAALETMVDAHMLLRPSRKRLFARVDRELRQIMTASAGYNEPQPLLKELLYVVAVGDGKGPLASQVKQVFNLTALPFNDQYLEEQYQQMAGPGHSVMRSVSVALREELSGLKDLVDLIERGAAQSDAFAQLHALLGRLAKTLGVVGLTSAGNALDAQLPVVKRWIDAEQLGPREELNRLADAVLYTESMVASLERGERNLRPAEVTPGSEAESFAANQLAEARIVLLDEAASGLALAKRAITAYLESNGDKLHLANVPSSLQAVRGGLWFLEQQRAGELIGLCADYIQQHMLESGGMPSEQMLETLADALTSLEYFLEGGAKAVVGQPDVLGLASESVRALGMTA
ncbi:ferrous iron transporter B [Atopomonas sediminilitoris]|uniref:ferrous iron transporter B n=1 Tax=Atopomonas sediminilitoris TaxID=2919919 RepID=UPI001F4E4655|nr:ferrous iron transporter B [Atopomonas sediminilitoris]MCJ8168012.1 ferrous iron transporter B [Atopomonas sediminilitoris]